jgi:hypothetical protein
MSKKITCTRCLGKGYLDKKDIKREAEFYDVSSWVENCDCSYCGGKGKIKPHNFFPSSLIKEEKYPDYYFVIAIVCFSIVFAFMIELLKNFIPKSIGLVIISAIFSILVTRVILNSIFQKSNKNKK